MPAPLQLVNYSNDWLPIVKTILSYNEDDNLKLLDLGHVGALRYVKLLNHELIYIP